MNHFDDDDYDDDDDDDEGASGPYRPGWLTILISLLVMLALIATLILPLLRSRIRYRPPTPTPNILLEAASSRQIVINFSWQ